MARASTTALACLCLWLLACDTVGVKDAYTALDVSGNRKRDVFYTDTESIYCVIEMASGVTDVTVISRLIANTIYDPFTGEPRPIGAIVDVDEQAPGAGDSLTIAFEIEKDSDDDPYPAGAYTCEFLIDGALQATMDFEVRYPDCPFKPIESDTSCAGLVLYGTMCPGRLGGSCECGADSGTWECRISGSAAPSSGDR
jgi:hypothetical protein